LDIGSLIRGALQPLGEDKAATRTALSIEDGESLTYLELHERVNRYANALLDLGIERGDRVGMLLFNSLEYVGLYLATCRIGAIAVRLNWRLAADELGYAISDSGCRALCLDAELAAGIEDIRGELPSSIYVVRAGPGGGVPEWAIDHDVLLRHEPAEPPVPTPAAEDPAMIMYTSGTTGHPKGAVWTHGNAVAFALMQQSLWGFDRETVSLSSGPLFHVGSFEDLILPTLLSRGRAILMRSRNFEIERLMNLLEGLGVTEALLQPTMIYELLRLPAFADADVGSLRRIMTGGANVQPWALDGLAERLPETEILALYGLTEGGAISTYMSVGNGGGPRESVGMPLPLTEIRVVLDDGSEAGEGVDGEIWVRSPSSSSRYWNKPEASAETFVDGWCRTGDQGQVREGLLYVTGRKKDMIRSAGENIYPVEVENVLLEHPSIADAAVVAVPDERFLEAVCAVVVPVAGAELEPEEVVGFCRTRLAGYKKPRHVVFVAELPRTPTGKVRKQDLRDRYAPLGDAS
jgi:fatty-acyl-CoA synthase